ncbi:MAG: ubiquitin-like domain-containing protein [Kineosporiaceae bacterium]
MAPGGHVARPGTRPGALLAVPGENDDWSIVLEFLNGRPARVAAGAVVLGAVAGGAAAYAHSGTTVTLLVDGASRTVDADADTVQGLLTDQKISVSGRDIVAPALNTPLKDGEQVVVRFARPFTVTVDGVTHTYWTTALTVDQALTAVGIRADGAKLSASRSLPLGRQGLDLSISTPKSVTITTDGHPRAVTSTAPTIGALFAEQGISFDTDDLISPRLSTPVTEGLKIALIRVRHQRTTATEAVPFGTTRRTTADLYVGQTKVVTAGHTGTRTAVYDVVIAAGKVSGKNLVSATVTAAPVDQVVAVGTKQRPATTSSGASSGSSSGSSGGGSVGGGVDSLNWAALAQCESGGNPRAVNPAGYYGLYQFSLATWHSVGGSGNPVNASPAEQLYRAKLLYKRGGAGQWGCGAHLFE